MNEIMEGAATPVQVAGFAVALRMKGETPGEVAGLAEVMLRRATPISVPGALVDLVGTGGDGAHTVNISTMGAIVAAAAGVRVVKHGNRAASSACGAADVLEALGRGDRPAAGGQRASWWRRPGSRSCSRRSTTRPCGTPRSRAASSACPPCSTSSARCPTRPGRGPRRSACPTRGWAAVIAGVLAGRGCSALVFHGDDGLDELTPTTTSTVWVVHDGTVSPDRLRSRRAGAGPGRPEDLRGGDREHNAAVARAVLGGERGPVRDTVLLNAAAALAAAAGVPGADALDKALTEAFARASEALDSGAAAELLDRWVAASQRCRMAVAGAGGQRCPERQSGVRSVRSGRSGSCLSSPARTRPRGRAANRCGTRCGSPCA